MSSKWVEKEGGVRAIILEYWNIGLRKRNETKRKGGEGNELPPFFPFPLYDSVLPFPPTEFSKPIRDYANITGWFYGRGCGGGGGVSLSVFSRICCC